MLGQHRHIQSRFPGHCLAHLAILCSISQSHLLLLLFFSFISFFSCFSGRGTSASTANLEPFPWCRRRTSTLLLWSNRLGSWKEEHQTEELRGRLPEMRSQRHLRTALTNSLLYLTGGPSWGRLVTASASMKWSDGL